MSTVQINSFWQIGTDVFTHSLETDSFIYRYYFNAKRENIGLFYDKLTDKWDAAVVKNGWIKTQNMRVNRLVHQLNFAA